MENFDFSEKYYLILSLSPFVFRIRKKITIFKYYLEKIYKKKRQIFIKIILSQN